MEWTKILRTDSVCYCEASMIAEGLLVFGVIQIGKIFVYIASNGSN